ncbi:MAG TPA: monofunctional biosynthetic peptidoglycan transglycosylase [Arenibaculum sp.]|nr:monofunctional biosynthetic peptidoglycan transglycosylase [Arenibaculum sp.]
MRRIARFLVLLALGLLALSVVGVLAYRVLPVPATALMLIRAFDDHGIEKDWVPLSDVSPHLVRAVIGSEDSRFCTHSGFDWEALRAAWRETMEGGRLRGGSTISMQTAKNTFLWPDRTFVRKVAEAWFTLLIETFWPKPRIMEVYLNVIEWGPGIYGAQAAARHWFGKPAASLTAREAARLTAVLPAPLSRSPAQPSAFVARTAGIIEQRMAIVARDGLADCALP